MTASIRLHIKLLGPRPGRLLEKCKIFVQDKAGKSGEVPGEKGLGKPNLPDKSASLAAPFESCAEKALAEQGGSELVSLSPDFRRCQAVFKRSSPKKWRGYK